MRQSKYTRELLGPIAERAVSLGQVLAGLNLRRTGGNYRMIAGRLRALEISTAHFAGQGWARGETRHSHPAVARASRSNARPDELVFVENSPEFRGQALARRLLQRGWLYRCAECGADEWRGKRLSLHLDHVNGISNDNRLENLRFLCPNCHSQTATYCRRMAERAVAR